MYSSIDFRSARDRLLKLRTDATAACQEFEWPIMGRFNWVRDHFDVLAHDASRVALRVVDDYGADSHLTYAGLSARSKQVAALLAGQGLGRGDRVLVMLGNVVPLWETTLACMRFGAVMVPTTTLSEQDDLADRLERALVKAVVTDSFFVRLEYPQSANAAR